MRSGAVTNRTYRVWGKIKLPKYLFKLHTVCGTRRGSFYRTHVTKTSARKNRGQRSIDSLSSSKGRDALYNTPIHNQFLREKSFFGIEKHLEWSTQLWSNDLFIYHLFTAPFTALNAHRVSLFCGVGVTEVLEPSILKTDECGSVVR